MRICLPTQLTIQVLLSVALLSGIAYGSPRSSPHFPTGTTSPRPVPSLPNDESDSVKLHRRIELDSSPTAIQQVSITAVTTQTPPLSPPPFTSPSAASAVPSPIPSNALWVGYKITATRRSSVYSWMWSWYFTDTPLSDQKDICNAESALSYQATQTPGYPDGTLPNGSWNLSLSGFTGCVYKGDGKSNGTLTCKGMASSESCKSASSPETIRCQTTVFYRVVAFCDF